MGKWSQYRKRGTHSVTTEMPPSLSPPVFGVDWDASGGDTDFISVNNLGTGTPPNQWIHFQWGPTGSGTHNDVPLVDSGQGYDVNTHDTAPVDVRAAWSDGGTNVSDYSANSVILPGT